MLLVMERDAASLARPRGAGGITRGLSRAGVGASAHLAWRVVRRVAREVAWVVTPGRTDRRMARTPRGWLFVVGVNNSGMTLLAQLLGAHPATASLPNGRVLGELAELLGLAPLPEAAWRGPQEVHNAVGAAQPIADMNAGSLVRLTPEDVGAITGICGETMARLGYDAVDPELAGGGRGGARGDG